MLKSQWIYRFNRSISVFVFYLKLVFKDSIYNSGEFFQIHIT